MEAAYVAVLCGDGIIITLASTLLEISVEIILYCLGQNLVMLHKVAVIAKELKQKNNPIQVLHKRFQNSLTVIPLTYMAYPDIIPLVIAGSVQAIFIESLADRSTRTLRTGPATSFSSVSTLTVEFRNVTLLCNFTLKQHNKQQTNIIHH